ncbi:MAG: hypothetical protein JWM98_2497, partial [Thermoleophilia bacterium]|nr:hypothetical protein [Thermoleophilia bacterium]
GLTVTGGAYRAASSINLTGTLTLDAQGNPSQVFIFQIGSSLTTATSSRVLLVNGAQSCNVFWQVGSSATLGTASTFDGTLLALTSITAQHGATVDGRLLARNGAVTLDDNTVTSNGCASAPIPPGGGGTGGGGTTPTPGGTAPTGGGGGATGGGNGTSILTPTSTVVARHIGVYGTTRCLPRTFSVSVRGLFIRRVVFSVQGRNIATRTTAPFAAMVEPVAGIRTVRARVTYSDGTAPVTLTMRYRACAKAAVPTRPTAPRVPIRPPAFTG